VDRSKLSDDQLVQVSAEDIMSAVAIILKAFGLATSP
jgi:hypothetical protein